MNRQTEVISFRMQATQKGLNAIGIDTEQMAEAYLCFRFVLGRVQCASQGKMIHGSNV